MSAQSSILPGWTPHITHVKCLDCKISFIEKSKGDSPKNWHKALEGGEQATQQYLQRHNAVTHLPNCKYSNIPPSVHEYCWKQKEMATEKAYEKELSALLRKKYDLH